MVKARWGGVVLAESDDTVVVEGNHYFPREDVRLDFLEASDHRSVCGWKGEARYHHVVVEGERNEDAAWEYPDPKPQARHVRGRIAFWNGVRVG